jgi:hypothetical protein
MNLKKITTYLFWTLCFYFLFTTSLFAVMIPLSTELLTRDSDLVILGEVIEVESFWNQDRTLIYTTAQVYVYDRAKSDEAQFKTTVTVEYVGGLVGDVGLRVSDAPVLKPGETVVLFLKRTKSRRDGVTMVHEIVAGAQGKYTVGEDKIARKDGFTVLLPDGKISEADKAKTIIDNHLPVDQLLSKVGAFAKREEEK